MTLGSGPATVKQMARTGKGGRSGWTQRRGEQRRDELMQAAEKLLESREIADISLEDVARAAGIPVASAYHFYPDRQALFSALAARISAGFLPILSQPLPPRQRREWKAVLRAAIHRAARFYERHPAARKLLLDGKAPAEIRMAERLRDKSVALLVEGVYDSYFVLPAFIGRTEVFFHTVEIADLIFQLSVMQHGRITPKMERHAFIASEAYLGRFLPERLPPR